MLLNAYVPPKVFPWFNLLSLGFPFLITGYILLTIFWILSWKKRAFVFLFLGLLFFNSTIRWVNYSSRKNEIPDLKVISFNTRSGLGQKNEVRKYMKDSGADIILLQEDGNKGYESLGYQTLNPKDDLTVLSKYKIVDSKIITLNGNKFISAPAIQIDIEIKGKIYRFINVYLHPFKFEKSMIKLDGSNEEDEKKVKNIIKRMIPTFKVHQHQVSVIKKAVENSPYPVILAGDFNSVPNSYEYYHLLDGLQDAFVEAGSGSSTSFHDYKFPIRIDYIFASKTIQPISYKVDRSVHISDHYPVIATFKLNK
jgi:endonuclease/exonuclease/phosphatase family metal-dependent hydrolase